jgi:hypothetical protein
MQTVLVTKITILAELAQTVITEQYPVVTVAKDSRENLSVTVNRVLDAIYSKTFLGSHSLSGGLPKTKKKVYSHQNQTVKRGLPKNDLADIIRKH